MLEDVTVGKGWAAMHYAADAGNYKRIDWLHSRGANASVRTRKGVTALMMAARAGEIRSCISLLKAGANIDMQDKTGKTALYYAGQCTVSSAVLLFLALRKH